MSRARPHRQADLGAKFAAAHESAVGTKRTWPNVRLESAFGGKSGSAISGQSGPLMTHLGHWTRPDLIRSSHPRNIQR
jgi:hypothetical protein